MVSADGKFSGSAAIVGKAFAMQFEGTWKVDGTRLVWTYTKSSPPLPEALRVDSDEVLSVDEKTLVVRSRLSGEVRTFKRE
jgi:hypothetical protein